MKPAESPCKGCKERTETCHGSCELYKAWKAEYGEYIKAVKERRMQEYIMRDYEQKKHKNLKKIMLFYTQKK